MGWGVIPRDDDYTKENRKLPLSRHLPEHISSKAETMFVYAIYGYACSRFYSGLFMVGVYNDCLLVEQMRVWFRHRMQVVADDGRGKLGK